MIYGSEIDKSKKEKKSKKNPARIQLGIEMSQLGLAWLGLARLGLEPL